MCHLKWNTQQSCQYDFLTYVVVVVVIDDASIVFSFYSLVLLLLLYRCYFCTGVTEATHTGKTTNFTLKQVFINNNYFMVTSH